MKTHRISSNITLFFKFFLPIFWVVFFGAFTVAVFAYNYEYYGNIPGKAMRWGTFLFYAGGVTLIVMTLWRLKRVETGEDFFYVTDYFRHRKYPFTGVAKLTETNLFLFKIVNIHFSAAGTFGKQIFFIASGQSYRKFLNEHPELEAAWMEEES
ncbi:MAG: hypothetical protein ACKV1O_05300 [Saprospiraceae bacterium]